MTTTYNPLLRVEQLEISYYEGEMLIPVVQNTTFQVNRGEMVALTGPSGCGKSMTAHAIVGLLESGMTVTDGSIYYNDCNIIHYDEKRWQRLRREEISLLIQHSINGLNPIQTIKKQMIETYKQKKHKKEDMNAFFFSLLSKVGFSDPEHILSSYPFELSGGMRQRVLLAMILSLQPKLLIADEPTTALDAINREKVLSLLKQLQKDFELTIMLISHDQKSVNRFADRVLQMSLGGSVS